LSKILGCGARGRRRDYEPVNYKRLEGRGMEGLTRGFMPAPVKEGHHLQRVAPSLIETDMMRGRPEIARQLPLAAWRR